MFNMQANALVTIPILQKFKLYKGAELGTRRGDFSYALLENVLELEMICVDIWKDHSSLNERHDHNSNYNTYLKLLDNHIKNHRVRTLVKLTSDACHDVEDRSLDFIFIDATHTGPAFLEDLKNWYPKVKDTGIIMGHDYHESFDQGSLIAAIDKAIGITKLLQRTGSDSAAIPQLLEHLSVATGGIADQQTGCWYCWKTHTNYKGE